MKKILHIVGTLERGGIQANLMNYYRNINTSKVQFDVIVHKKVGGFEDEFKDMGGCIYCIPTIKEMGLYGYIRKVKEIIKCNGPYYGIHSHLMYQTGIILLAAKLEKVRVRISHAHTSAIDSKFYKYTMPLWKLLIKMTATKLVACSQEAGNFMYGSRTKFEILPNAIDYVRFKHYDIKKLIMLKSILNISDDNIVLGHVGRFVEVKNHKFIIELLKKIVSKNEKAILVLVGDGPLLTEIKAFVKSEGLSRNVIFLGEYEDVNVILNLFDVFLFPSFYEGFGIVALEAQLMGVKCIVSNSITRSVDIGLGLVDFVSLEQIHKWIALVSRIKDHHKLSMVLIERHMETSSYNVLNSINLLYEIYGI